MGIGIWLPVLAGGEWAGWAWGRYGGRGAYGSVGEDGG